MKNSSGFGSIGRYIVWKSILQQIMPEVEDWDDNVFLSDTRFPSEGIKRGDYTHPMRSLSVDLVSFNHNKAVLYKSFDTYSSVWYHEKLYETENMLEQMDFDVYFIPYYLEPTPDVIEYVFGIQVDEHKSLCESGFYQGKYAPANFCSMGWIVFLDEYYMYPDSIRRSIRKSLIELQKSYKGRVVLPMLHRPSPFNVFQLTEFIDKGTSFYPNTTTKLGTYRDLVFIDARGEQVEDHTIEPFMNSPEGSD